MQETLFKGATRSPIFLGIPLKPFFYSVLPISILAMLISIWLFILLIPIYFILKLILKNDEKFFTELEARLNFFKDSNKTSIKNNLYKGLRSYSTFNYPKNKTASLAIHQDALKEKSISDYIPYINLVSENIIKTNNNEYLSTLELEGKAFYTLDEQDLSDWKDSLNNNIKSIASISPDITFFTHIIREQEKANLSINFNNEFSKNLNQQHLDKFQQIYVNRLFLTIILKNTGLEQENIQIMKDILSQLETSLSSYKVKQLTTYIYKEKLFSKQLEFYAYLINKEWIKIPVLNIPINTYIAINKLLCSNHHLEVKTLNKTTVGAVIDIKEYDEKTNPEQLNEFLSLPFELTIAQSFRCMSKIKSTELLRVQYSHLNNSNDYASSQTDSLKDALDDIQSGRMVYGEHHCNIFIWGENQSQVDKNTAKVKEILADMAIVPKVISPALECAFFASLPANFNYRLRPAPISSKNFACFANFHNHFMGKKDNNPWGEAVTIFETNNLTPIYFNFHEEQNYNQLGDKALGNTLIIGQSGAGKTVLANFLLSNLDKFNTTTIFFDKDKGAKIALLAMGGKYFDLKVGQKTNWNPLHLENNPENIIFLNQLIKTMLCHSERILDITQISQLEKAINAVMSVDKQYRNLKSLSASMPCNMPNDIGTRLNEWIGTGQYAWLFDNQDDELDLNVNSIIGFDCTEFLEYPTIRTPLMMYLLYKMEQIIDGRRFTFFMDEFWKLLQDPIFTTFAKDKLKTIRKQNGLGVFMTQEPADALNSIIGKTIIQQTATQILLPNPKADDQDYLQGLKITQTEFELLKNFDVSSRQFIIKKGHSSTVAKLNLYGFNQLNVLSGNTQNTSLVEQLIKQDFTTTEWLNKIYGA